MSKNKTTNIYDDDNIPEVDLPQKNTSNCSNCSDCKTSNKTDSNSVEPLPESTRPRKDGPGGN